MSQDSDKTLIFDFNGTLDNFNNARAQALKDMVSDLGREVSIPPEKLLLMFEKEYHSGKDVSERECLEKILSEISTDFDGEGVLESFRSSFRQHQELTDSSARLLKSLENYRIIILSYEDGDIVRELLKDKDVFETVDHIYSLKEMDEDKPSAKVYEKVFEQNRIDPSKTVMVGDGVVNDILPAHAIGVTTVLVSDIADFCLSSIEDVKDLLETISDK